ncbi:General stress protein 69 [Pseudodesulfovibrio hydrargyri]|uniref:General stress protein 69 n=1 Tax=Pseudodesulfovibrio hydrargyri TaxID=2125990 RepID=A0A1J5N1B1_9BACT|nr:aldo/keto reductase [Pseudodesulfovibrio hydrargyri]OIQ51916.1 General stress protein 69 [Pseudodesulfovibrio hydrargyri]
MKTRMLGKGGLSVSAIGLGCMGMSDFYGPREESQSLGTLNHALDVGVNFWDTADMYGLGGNERLLGKVLAKRRDEVVLATKFGVVRNAEGEFTGLDGRPEYVRKACEASLRRLGTDHIDLYYQHRMDPDVPIEETVGAMARLVEEGKVRHLGLCEITADELRRAAAVHPITALQYEYSLWTREVEGDILDACRELGIGLVAYSPMGRGFLTGKIKSRNDLSPDDWRLENPRFSEANLARNLKLVETVEAVARDKGCTPAQLALAWLLAQGGDVVPIPGTRRAERLDENAAAVDVGLSAEDLRRIDAALPPGTASGERY